MSTWKGARNSYSKGSCRVTWTLTAQRLGHAMDWRLAMSAGRRLGPSKAGSGWGGARGVRKAITRLEGALAAGNAVARLAGAIVAEPPPPGVFFGFGSPPPSALVLLRGAPPPPRPKGTRAPP